MPCPTCGATDHAADACPKKPPAPDKVDKLVEAIQQLVNRPAPTPSPSPDPEPRPSPAPKGMSESEIGEKFKELVNAGKADEAFRFVNEHGITPRLNAMMTPVLVAMGEQNIQLLRTRDGERFTKREPLLRAKIREYGVTPPQLADMKVVEDLWTMVKGADPTWNKEITDEALKNARAEWEAENAKNVAARMPSGLAPITPPKPELKDDWDKFVGSGLSEKERREYVDYLEHNLSEYGVSPEAYLAQLKAQDDPRNVEQVGIGPFKKRTWTRVTPVDAPPLKKGK